MNELALIQSLIEELNQLEYGNKSKLEEFRKNGEMMIGSIFGQDDDYVLDFQNIQFLTSNKNADQIEKRQKWLLGSSTMLDLLKTIQEDLKLFEIATVNSTIPKSQKEPKKQVFIIHGQDDMMLQLVSRTLKELRINPLILSKHPNKKRSIINNFSVYSDESFAIVLFTLDDINYPEKDNPENATFQAQQDVTFEFGFFLGKLGKDRVFALYQPDERLELPSGYTGIKWIPFDDSGLWQMELLKKLEACHFKVNPANLVL